MDKQTHSPADRLQHVAERPVRLIAMICQMILGLAMLIAVVVKAYMTVLTDHQCVADAAGLGNLLRCEPTLGIMAAIMGLSAGVELARSLFKEGLETIVAPILLGIGAAFLALVSGFQGSAGWREALLVLSLMAAMGGAAWIGRNLLKD